MPELRSSGFLVLGNETVMRNIPSRPGIYTLAVLLPNGVHSCFYSTRTRNLHRSLRSIIATEALTLPAAAKEIMRRFRCYFTYFVIVDEIYREEIEKMLTNTVDPVRKLTIVAAN